MSVNSLCVCVFSVCECVCVCECVVWAMLSNLKLLKSKLVLVFANQTYSQGGRVHWTGNYTGTQSFINNFLIRWMKLDWFLKTSNVLTFSQQFLIYKRCNFVIHHWEIKSNYLQLSYPLRFLRWTNQFPFLFPFLPTTWRGNLPFII